MTTSTDTPPIAFIDLKAQRARLGDRVDKAITRVLDHGQYIMGPEVHELEARLAEYCGVRHALSCASGTDALLLPLLAWGVGPGDAILCPSFTFAATAEVVALVGATPVFVDIRADTYNLDPADLAAAFERVPDGLRTVGVIAVDLFGQPAEYDEIAALCSERGLWLLSDAAQSFGGSAHGRRACAFGDVAGTSFFPAKPLGCYGDGGAIFTDDDDIADVMRSLRIHGQGSDKYDNVRIGINGRLDTIQAAVLLEKLDIFDDELRARQALADGYARAFGDRVKTPAVLPGHTSAWAQYTIEVEDRDGVATRLREAGVPTAVYYPKPLHQQSAYRHFPSPSSGLPISELCAGQVLSLPFHPYMDEPTFGRIVEAVQNALT